MTVSIRIAHEIAAAVLSLSLAFATTAFAQDAMQQDLEFRNSLSRYDGAKKEVISKDPTATAERAGKLSSSSFFQRTASDHPPTK